MVVNSPSDLMIDSGQYIYTMVEIIWTVRLPKVRTQSATGVRSYP